MVLLSTFELKKEKKNTKRREEEKKSHPSGTEVA